MHDAADDSAIVRPLDAPDIRRQVRFDPLPLLIAQPKQVIAHDPNPLPKTNQDRIVRAEKLMSSDPSTAIRELMSRGWPPKSTSPVRLAHIEFVAALAGNVPYPIYADVDSEDLDGRADHLEKVLRRCTSILARSSRTRRRTYQLARLIAATSTTCSRTWRPTRWTSSAMVRRKCASTRIGGRRDPPVRERT